MTFTPPSSDAPVYMCICMYLLSFTRFVVTIIMYCGKLMKLNVTSLTILNLTCPSSSVNRTSTVARIQILGPSSQKNYILVLNVCFLFMLQYFEKNLIFLFQH